MVIFCGTLLYTKEISIAGESVKKNINYSFIYHPNYFLLFLVFLSYHYNRLYIRH